MCDHTRVLARVYTILQPSLWSTMGVGTELLVGA